MMNPVRSVSNHLPRRITSVLHPAGFHGQNKTRNFFEGWYIKLVSADQQHRLAVIPGVFLGPTGQGEAFVQILDGISGDAQFHSFPLGEFAASPTDFDVRVGANRFTTRGIELDLPEVSGRVTFSSPMQPWPVTWRTPGIMGWYAWVPTMECYHGLLSFDHQLDGVLDGVGGAYDFRNGRGYVEKDWGQAFPSAYVWMQTNHFDTPHTSLSASIANIPWRRSSFRGFIVGLYRNGSLTQFATYTGAKTQSLEVDDDEVRWELVSKNGDRLFLTADRPAGGLLHAPVRTQMHRRVEETLDATISVTMTDKAGAVLFDDVGRCGGLEVHGDLSSLIDP